MSGRSWDQNPYFDRNLLLHTKVFSYIDPIHTQNDTNNSWKLSKKIVVCKKNTLSSFINDTTLISSSYSPLCSCFNFQHHQHIILPFLLITFISCILCNFFHSLLSSRLFHLVDIILVVLFILLKATTTAKRSGKIAIAKLLLLFLFSRPL